MTGYDTRRLADNLMSVTVAGALIGYLGRLTFDWPGVAVALAVEFVALWLAIADAQVDP